MIATTIPYDCGFGECYGGKHANPPKNDSAIIQCVECNNQASVDQFTEQELREDGWLLEPVVYCPVCGPDDDDKGER